MPRAPKAKDTPQAQSPPREVPRSGASNAATETRFNTAGMPLSSHNVDTVHPYVKKDVAASKEIPLYAWTEGALKLTKQDIFQWTTLIDELNWFEDPVVRENLTTYSLPGRGEQGRYAPFAAVANRVLELAKGTLPGVPHSYPVDDIRFVQNDPTYMRRIPEHGLLGALRKPDLLILRGVHAKCVGKSKRRGVAWVDVLGFAEFKRGRTALDALLEDILNKRDPPPVVESRESTPQPSNLGAPLTPQSPRRLRPRILPRNLDCEMEDLNSESSIREIEQTDDHFDQSSYDPTANKFTKKAASKDDVMTVKREADIQAGGYALEAAACTYGTRLFIHGIIIADDNLEFWYYDSSGYLRTKQTLSLFTDFCMVAAIIVGFARGDAAQWGALPPVISPPSSKPYPAHFPPKSLEDHSFDMTRSGRKGVVRVTLKTPIFSQYSLVGRRTILYDIETSSIVADTPLVVKMSYQVVGRMPEHKILAIAHKAKVGHLPKAHMWKDLWKLSDGVRQIFYERSKELSETGDDIATYEDRVLRALVYTKYLPIKTLFSKSVKFIPLMVDQMLDCLHDLRHKANILHRDISCHNIMYEMRDGDPYFILIDYDLAKVLGTGSEPSISLTAKHRTGTLPFMAHELLLEMVHKDNTDFKPKVIHRLRHEYESLFNVALWSSITMPVVKNRKQKEALLAHARLWESGTVVSVATFKYTMVTNTSLIDGIPLPPNAEYLRNYFKIWVLELSDGYQALQRYKSEMSRETIYFPNRRQPSRAFDLETMDGIITRDHLKAALAPCNVLKTSTGTINAEIPLSKSTGRGGSRASAPKKSPRSSKVTAATRSKADTTKKTSTIRKVNTAQKSQRAKSPKRSSPPRVVKPSGRAASVAKNIAPVMTRVTRSMAKKA